MSHEIILVVDDNRQIADFLAESMLPSLGYEVLVARDANTAKKVIKQHKAKFDLMLLDLQLPDMTGLELLRHLDKDGYHIPTILMTGHGSEQVAAEAFRLGVHDYLSKPLDENFLTEAITRSLAESRLQREKAILNSQLEEQVAWLTSLSKVGQSVTSTLELGEVLVRIVEAGVSLTKAEEGFLALLDKESGLLYLRAVKNMDEDSIKTLRIPIADSLVGKVIKSKRPLRAVEPNLQAPLKVSTGYLVHSLLHVPILSKGNPLGVLSVTNRKNDTPFKEKDEEVLSSLADYAAVALENADLYQQARQEITERQRAEDALRESEERYALAVRAANDGLWDWNLKKGQIYYSPRWKQMLGYSDPEIGDNPNEWFNRVHPDDIAQLRTNIAAHIKGLSAHFECEYRIQYSNGSYRWMLSRGMAVIGSDKTALRLAGSQTDITLRRQAEIKLLHDAFHDSLTELPNRSLFIDRLKHVIERSKRDNSRIYAVIFLDLDRFKDVNDSLGHLTGDQLLVATAHLLQAILRPMDTVARLGGDEFVILLEEIKDVSDVTRVADRIQKKLMMATLLPNHTIFMSASMGIVLSTTGYEHPEDILRDADTAMYRAKENGRSRYEIFDSAMRDQIMLRLELESALRQAIEKEELEVYYQPVVNVKTGRTVWFEALVRWKHTTRGLLLPGTFLPLADETGLIVQIDRFVMRKASEQLVKWQNLYLDDPPLGVSVNISGKQITLPDFVEYIVETLKQTGLSATSLNLEITENAVMGNYEIILEVLDKLNAYGIQVQIDDFGVGYSSLNYLSHSAIKVLKIDRSFISKITKDPEYLKIVQAIIKLTHGLGLTVVAEGVETKEQLAQLIKLECEYIQGKLISMPADNQVIGALLQKEHQRKPTKIS
ncbi:MAG: EAL domain-containing protein [Anaerolineales bacterium]|jgi:diguanylate cyclase (GGDEF)-like protein/PAS domain S-box-containing protein